MSLSNNALAAATAIMAAAMMSSCVNGDYDLTKDFDKTVTIDGDINVPIGNSETILISDILDLDEDGSGVLVTNAEGDYSLSVSGDRTETSFHVPTFSISKDLVTEGGYLGSIDRSDITGELGITVPGAPLPSGLKVTRRFNPSKTPIQINESVPSEIIDVKDVSGIATGVISLRTNVGKATVSGLSIKFPDYLTIGSVTSTGNTAKYIFGDNVLAFEPTEVSGSAVIIRVGITGIAFDKIPAGQGFLPDRHLIHLDDDIEISGFEVRILSDDIGKTISDIPEKITMDLGITVSSVDVSSAIVKVNPQINLSPMSVEVGTLPSFITGEGTVLDLYNPQITLRAINESPLSLTLAADLESVKGSSRSVVHIGNGATEEIRINAEGETRICLSRTGEGTPQGYASIVAPNLSDLVKDVPERIGITDCEVKAADEYITVRSGMNYRFSYAYDVLIPLAFGSDLKFGYSTDFTGWNETFDSEDGKDFEIRNADLTFDFVNMIPLGFGLSASAIDRQGDVIPEIKITVDGDAAPGSFEKPARTQRKLSLASTSGSMRRLDGIRLYLNASEPDKEYQGICLNKNQGIRLENMKLSMQGSITTEL